MAREMHEKEFESVVAPPGPRRYAYFLKKAADAREVWSLADADANWVLAGDEDGTELVPVWSHERFAAACATEVWAGSRPAPIPLEDWLEAWLPGIAEDERLVAIFPTPTGGGIPVELGRLRSDLEEELAARVYDDEP